MRQGVRSRLARMKTNNYETGSKISSRTFSRPRYPEMRILQNKMCLQALRLCQILFAIISMACIATLQVPFHSYQFLLLTTFTAWVVIFGMLFAKPFITYQEPASKVFLILLDGALAILLFSASLSVAVSDTFEKCGNDTNDCRVLKTAVSFGFLAMAAFVMTFVMNVSTLPYFTGTAEGSVEPAAYAETQTPPVVKVDDASPALTTAVSETQSAEAPGVEGTQEDQLPASKAEESV